MYKKKYASRNIRGKLRVCKYLAVSRTLSKKRSGMHEMGIDFAYDKKQQLWVLEVNSNHPQFHALKKLDLIAY
ncbi:YheC/YheD family protein [Paenibacillus luteus]|uniref:YheC/YheD family protein n=1 Tax=Paenibacillus luteus TaxID=2545753 RepID=UPI001144E13D|nr:YheC/YheD family protein [Paenibacillus luteus]